jgi:hypothetical protein
MNRTEASIRFLLRSGETGVIAELPARSIATYLAGPIPV